MRLLERLSNKILFSNISPLVKLGSTQPLEAEDMPLLPGHLDPKNVVIDESKVKWNTGLEIVTSIQFASRKFWLPQLSYYGVFAAMNLAGPVLVNLFVTRIGNGLESNAAIFEAAIYGIAVGLVGILGGLGIQHFYLHNLARTQIVTNILNKKIFTHALALTKEARERIPVGDIVNHMSADTDAVGEVGNAFADLLYCFIMVTGAVGLMYYYMGSTAWVAILLLSILAPLTRRVARDFTRFDEDLMKWRDQRVTLMAQILSAIRLVKYFVWEKSVADEVNAVRERELLSRRRIARAELVVTILYVSVSTLVLFSVFATHVWRGGTLGPALVFTCVSLFALLEDPFSIISRSLSQFISGKVGAERIARFLKEPVLPNFARQESSAPAVGFQMQDLSAHLGKERHPALIDISMKVPAGSSLAVIGSVGSGKSTFIHALLGEIEYSSGAFQFTEPAGGITPSCRIGFVPQEAFILNGTMRENLSFGRAHVSEAELSYALEVSALAKDIALLPGGLDAEIGEKGINLSGGQRQRVSLARAVLHRPQMVILDDPLSAVDFNTESHITKHLLFGEWKNITRVMITHRLSHLPQFDQIAFLDHGRLLGLGSFSDLSANCPEFRSYMEEFGRGQTSHSEERSSKTEETVSGEALRVTEEEDREQGAVHSAMYRDYVLALGGESKLLRPLVIFLLICAAASNTALPLLQKAWLAYVSSSPNTSSATEPLNAIYIYGLIGIFVMAGTLAANLFWLRQGLAAGRALHNKMLNSILGSSIRFFDSTPIGRVLQRFSRDMEAVDIHLQWCFEHSMKCLAQVLMTLAMIIVALPLIVIPLIPILFIYYQLQKLYRVSAREAKRLDSVSRSPRFAHFKETLTGLVVIRAFGQRDWFMKEFYERLLHSQRMFHGHYMINRWFSSRIPLVGGLVGMATTLMVIGAVQAGQMSPGVAGLLTVYSLSFWGVLNWGIRIWSEVEARMTSLERIQFYINLPQEKTTTTPVQAIPPEEWPQNGEVRFENVQARYADHMPFVLKDLSFVAPAGSRLGIVGRTGSGKSTLFQALYRFIELSDGKILLDGINIADVPLARLRRALAIIPQDPTLFMGSLRSNLDRYLEHNDQELWEVLDRTALGAFVRALPKQLDTHLVENGVNLSQGQRQLLCLARALLMKAKVIILDEATASVDVKTDAIVQSILREACAGVTMLIIAHRLGTVRDCDQIIELSEGRVIEKELAKEVIMGELS